MHRVGMVIRRFCSWVHRGCSNGFQEIRKIMQTMQAVSVKDFLVAMEDKGEIVSFMGHTKDGDQLTVNENIVFIMDEVKSSPTKKRRVSKVLLGFRNVLFEFIPPPPRAGYVSAETQ